MSIPLINRALSILWAVVDKIDFQEIYYVGVQLLGVSDFKWQSAYTPNNRNGYCNLNQNADRAG